MNELLFETAILYTRDSIGAIIQWSCKVYDSPTGALLVTEYGRYNGKLHKHNQLIKEGKNIGKRNETTPVQQAIKELKSKVKHKIKEGYRSVTDLGGELSKDNDVIFTEPTGDTILPLHMFLELKLPEFRLDENNFLKPMLAKPYKAGKVTYPRKSQPKINGVRAFISIRPNKEKGLFDSNNDVVITSREGLVYHISHIEDAMVDYFKKAKDIGYDVVFDGELYIKDKLVTTIGGAAKNQNNPLHKQLKFVCFDLAIDVVIQNKRDNIREAILGDFVDVHEVYDKYVVEQKHIFNLYSDISYSDIDSMNFTEKYIGQGYEGAILRNFDAEYQFGKRNSTMWKSKKFFDEEYSLIDIIPTEKDTDDLGRPTCLFVCELPNGSKFNVTPYGYSKSMKAELLIYKSAHIGKQVTVKYYEKTKTGIPFHANGHLRDYE